MKAARLRIISGPQAGREFSLTDLSVFEAGKGAGTHIKLRDPEVAFNHFRLFRKGDTFTLYALSETKPTLVNGEEVRKAVLKPGDRIRAGSTEFVFEFAEEGERAAEEPEREKEPEKDEAETLEGTQSAPGKGPAPGPARLRVVDGEDRGQSLILTGRDRWRIGRATNSDFRLRDPKVSRDHCVIERIRDEYIIIDLESANGTVVNGERVKKTILRDGDFVRLGYTILRFELASQT